MTDEPTGNEPPGNESTDRTGDKKPKKKPLEFVRFTADDERLSGDLRATLELIEQTSGMSVEYAPDGNAWCIRCVGRDTFPPLVAMASTLRLAAKRMMGIIRATQG